MKYFLAREGIAFGPYTEFQLRESHRLGIFDGADLALAEDGKEWTELAGLLASLPLAAEALHATTTSTTSSARRVASEASRHRLVRRVVALPPFGKGAVALALLLAIFCAYAARELPRREKRPAGIIAHTPIRHEIPAVALLARVHPQPIAASSAAVLPPPRPAAPATAAPSLIPAPPPLPVESPQPLPTAQTAATPDPSRQIKGQIFIASLHGLDYQPSSVEVRLYPLALLKPYLEKRGSEGSARFEELKAKIKTAEAEKERSRQASDAAFDLCVRADAHAPNLHALERASADAKKARENATNAYYRLLQDRESVLSGAFYLQDLPPSEQTTRTDRSGGFTFEVPADGEFAVVAGAQRNIDEATEHFYWFVPVRVQDEPVQKVLLSNNNLSSQGSLESLVQTVD